ncbi:adenine deaminase [Methanocaldococcus indicus]|uniref:adenine deaminase n=1 Tax=Methanocaldococcus indicus TaxID=213231 RepID=UPI003C6D551C
MITLKDIKVVDVYTGEIVRANVVFDEKIRVVDFDCKVEKGKVYNLDKCYLSPTFIDAHIHIESSHLIPSIFENYALKSGVSKVVIDPHEIANVLGKDGIKFMLNNSNILEVYVMLPSCVPPTDLETSGAEITYKDIEELIYYKNVLGLGEVMNYIEVINEDEEILKKIEVAKKYNKLVDGHCPLLRGEELNKYIEKGIQSDHECVEEEEALEKIRLGLKLMVREGTVAKNIYLLNICKKIKDKRNIMLVSDDISIEELKKGYMLNILKKALKYISPIEAIQMVTINPAEYFKLETGIKPGNYSDFIIFEDLENFKIKEIFIKGKNLSELLKNKKVNAIPTKFKNTMNFTYKKEDDFNIELKKDNVRVIEPIEDSLITKEKIIKKDKINKYLDNYKINKIFVVERHKNTGNIGKGFIYNFLEDIVLASSYAHDTHNIVVIGNNNKDIVLAVNTLKDIGGGFIAVRDGKILKYVKMPIAGIMADKDISKDLEEMNKIVKDYVKFENPFLKMSFFTLSVIPQLKITDKGLVKDNKIVDISF